MKLIEIFLVPVVLVLPFIASVINDADATEMAQPLPSKLTSVNFIVLKFLNTKLICRHTKD